MYHIVFEDVALQDVSTAKGYYKFQRNSPMQAERFQKALTEAINFLRTNAHTPRIRQNGYRYKKVGKFPYVIVYILEQQTVIVDAVFNTYQNPSRLLARI